MKTLTLLLLLFFGVFTTMHSQKASWAINLSGGASKIPVIDDSPLIFGMPAWDIGVQYQLSLQKNWSIDAGLTFAHLRTNTRGWGAHQFEEPVGWDYSATKFTDLNHFFIKIPIHINFHLSGWSLGLGPELLFSLGGLGERTWETIINKNPTPSAGPERLLDDEKIKIHRLPVVFGGSAYLSRMINKRLSLHVKFSQSLPTSTDPERIEPTFIRQFFFGAELQLSSNKD